MTINRKHFKTRFERLPAWVCSACQTGTLQMVHDTLNILETGPSKTAHSLDGWDVEWIEERFCALLKCSDCSDLASISGSREHDLHQYMDMLGEFASDITNSLKPHSIQPPPLVFPIPNKAPDNLKEALLKAFSLIWVDTEACANRIRTCLEIFLDDKKIPKTKKTRKTKRSPSLFIGELKNTPKLIKIPLAYFWQSNGSGTPLAILMKPNLSGLTC
ncbi:MAG: hypothetical protein GY892_06975 [Shimia sp.]|nr:hypothetical protein [Shimia sp.]